MPDLSLLSDRSIYALQRIAKDPRKGLRPFFADAKGMMALRAEAEKRKATTKGKNE